MTMRERAEAEVGRPLDQVEYTAWLEQNGMYSIADISRRFRDGFEKTVQPSRPIVDAILEVYEAIMVEGPRPEWHRYAIAKSRHEWPTLWVALDHFVVALDNFVAAAEGRPTD